MAVFTDKMHLKGKAEEDLYFAELDRKLIEALHEKQAKERESGTDHIAHLRRGDNVAQK